MKDKLEKYISEHRHEFDDLKPSEAMWDKIAGDLPPKQKKIPLWTIARVAASVLIVVASYLYFVNNGEQQTTITVAETSQPEQAYGEIKEAEMYYSAQIDEAQQELFMVLDDQPQLKKDIQKELEELNKAYKELENDLMDNTNNEEIIEYMIQNYRLKLEILKDMLQQIKQARNYEEEEDDYISL